MERVQDVQIAQLPYHEGILPDLHAVVLDARTVRIRIFAQQIRADQEASFVREFSRLKHKLTKLHEAHPRIQHAPGLAGSNQLHHLPHDAIGRVRVVVVPLHAVLARRRRHGLVPQMPDASAAALVRHQPQGLVSARRRREHHLRGNVPRVVHDNKLLVMPRLASEALDGNLRVLYAARRQHQAADLCVGQRQSRTQLR